MKTCETCAFYVHRRNQWGEAWQQCDDQTVENAVHVTVADDTNLNTSFRPPPTFGCSQHVEKA